MAMKVLVTGGCGFLGSHVCEYYSKKGDQVVSYDNLTKYELMRTGFDIEGARSHNWNILKTLGVELIKRDVRDREELFKAASGCDFIIHTAAQPAMTIAIEDPALDFSTNVGGTFNVLEASKHFRIPMVNCSSIHVYGNRINEDLKETGGKFTRVPPEINEEYPIMHGSITPLHASKRAAEVYVQAYTDTYGVEAATFRLTGMYGPRQFGGEDHGWVANFVIRTILGLPVKVFGNDKQGRDVLYVTDAVAAFDAFFNNRIPGTYNIGGGMKTYISLGESLALIKEITGMEQQIKVEPARLGDLWYFSSDCAKARSNLKWEPKVSCKEGITSLVNWVRENISIFKVKNI
ncbi:MAG: NAD-dependent epimerase/dehydratase family protein [Vulcanimicrobiota bacterium]